MLLNDEQTAFFVFYLSWSTMKSYNLLICLLIFLFSCSGNPDKNTLIEKKSTRSTDSDNISINQAVKVQNISTDSIFSQNSGTMEWLNTKKAIRKGTNLYSLDNSKSFELIYTEKKKCKQIIDSLIQTCPNDLATVLPKWQSFSNKLKLDTLTPVFPKIAFREEAAHFGNNDFIETYNDLLKKERKMKSNFQIAKAAYTEIQWRTKRGQKVKKGQLIGIAYRKI